MYAFSKLFFLSLVLLWLAGCDTSQQSDATNDTPIVYREINWEVLVPEGYRPDAVLEEYAQKYKLDELDDYDPIVLELEKKLKALLASAPVDETLADAAVKLAGYILPLESDGSLTSEFLLVPYFGACIHVPPPPANQTIYVKMDEPIETDGLFDAVWVYGTLKIERQSSEYAEAGYTMQAIKVEEYELPAEGLSEEELSYSL